MAIQQVINHIHNGVDFVVEHAQTDSDMVLHGKNKLSDFMKNMFPNTGGTITGHVFMQDNLDVFGFSGFKKNMYLDQELIIKDYYNENSAGCSIWFNGRDGEILFFDRVNSLQVPSGEIKAGKLVSNELGFYQDLGNGTEVKIDGRGGSGSSYNLGWYFSNAKGAFVDLYAKNVQNQCDARVKDIIPPTKEIKVTPNPIENITPKRYKYHGEEKIRFGFIAQEIEAYIPEAVTTLKYDLTETNIPIDKFGNKILDCKTVDLMAITATLWQEVKNLKEEIKVLQSTF